MAAILIKVKNAAELARSQGAVASLAQSIAPETIAAKVYATMRDKLAESLAKEHVDAEVTLVDPAGYQPAGGSGMLKNIGLFGAGAGIVGLLWFMLGRSGPHKTPSR